MTSRSSPAKAAPLPSIPSPVALHSVVDATAGHLRHLAVTVEERSRGRFTWLVLEGGKGGLYERTVAEAPRALDSYSQAIREGAEALARLAENSTQGPRRP